MPGGWDSTCPGHLHIYADRVPLEVSTASIESYVNSHIGFDPDYEVIKETRPASNKTPDERMAYLVVVIVQEGNNKQFHVF